MSDGASIHGSCDGRFAGVREALRENFSERGELGAAVCVIVDGRTVVDLWGGWADAERSRPWRQDSVVNAFSVGKAFAALCALVLASRGLLELDAPVARYWPEFAAEGKERVTVRQVLSHRAGLAAIERELPEGALYEREVVARALGEQRPWWTPGEEHGYHVHTFGFLVGEIVRRVAGESVGSFLRREIAKPLGADVGFGLAASERGRRAEYVFDAIPNEREPRAELVSRRATAPRSRQEARLYELAYLNPPGATGLGTVNTEAWMDAELPSGNLHAGARGVARVYAALIGDGDRARARDASSRAFPSGVVDRDVLGEATRQASAGVDRVLGRPSRFGLGFQLTQPERPLGPNAESFGHFGAGGSVGFADPQAGLAFAYVMNRGGPQWRDPRNRALVGAAYGALGDR